MQSFEPFDAPHSRGRKIRAGARKVFPPEQRVIELVCGLCANFVLRRPMFAAQVFARFAALCNPSSLYVVDLAGLLTDRADSAVANAPH